MYLHNTKILIIILIFFTASIPVTGTGQENSTPDILRLTVEESIDIAMQKSKSLLIAQAKITEQEKGVGISRAALLPKLSTAFNYTRLDFAPFFPTSRFMSFGGGGQQTPPEDLPKKIVIGDPHNYSASLSIQQPIYTGGTLTNSYGIAELQAENAKIEFEQSKNELAFNVENSYWNALKAIEFSKVADESIKQVRSHLEDLENMYQVGMVTENDLLLTKVQLSNAELVSIQANNGIRLAKISFCNVLGISLDTEIMFTDKLEPGPYIETDLNQLLQKAFSLRPELQSLDATIEISEKAVGINKAGYLPKVFLNANYGYQRPDRMYDPYFYATWTVSIMAQFNLFDWGETSLKTDQAKSRVKQLEIAKQQLKDGVTLEVTQNYLALNEAKEKIEKSRLSVEQAEENYRVTNEKFREGLATNTQIYDANILLVQARTNYVSALADYKIALARLKKATGVETLE